jgi:hypothetical protein
VERNSLQAGLGERAQDWRWSSLRPDAEGPAPDPGPVPRAPDWLEFVNTSITEAEVVAIRLSLRWDRPPTAPTRGPRRPPAACAWNTAFGREDDSRLSATPGKRSRKAAQTTCPTTSNKNVPFGLPCVPFGLP